MSPDHPLTPMQSPRPWQDDEGMSDMRPVRPGRSSARPQHAHWGVVTRPAGSAPVGARTAALASWAA